MVLISESFGVRFKDGYMRRMTYSIRNHLYVSKEIYICIDDVRVVSLN